jgi:hypothetical protein
MGAQQSQLGTQADGKPGMLQRLLPGTKQYEPLPIPKIIDLDFILATRPNPPPNLPILSQSANLMQITERILRYNREQWNFGNLQGEPQKLMNENTYKLFLNFVQSKIVPNSPPFTLSTNTNIQTKQSFEENISIIEEIHGMGIPEVNKFFTVKLSDLFPEIKGLTDQDIINVTLLGLAAIIGAEHLVIYFLMCGANPGITLQAENEDTGTLMLLYQIALTKIQTPPKYFIILARMLYILFLLGSVGSGVDLSLLFTSNFNILKRNERVPTPVKESILHQLVKIPYINIDFSNQNKNLIYLKMQNGASIPLLFKVIQKQNIKGPNLWSNINTQDEPLGYTVLYSLLMNKTIESKIKLSLVWYLIKAGADPLIIPNIRQNAQVKQSVFAKENQTEIQLLFALLQESNMQILGDLLKILSLNEKFKNLYDEFKISEPGVNQDKNMTIQRLKKNNDRLRQILIEVEKQKIIQVNSAIKESALIGSIRNQNKEIQQQLKMKQNLEITNPVQLQYNTLMQPQKPVITKPIDKMYQTTKPMPYQQKLAIPQRTYPGQRTPPYAGGGVRIAMRTFYLLKHKKYSKQSFKAERPIVAAHNAYDFLKLHDKIGKKQISMTIYDIANNKKYKYIAKTLKDGKNVLKSYK